MTLSTATATATTGLKAILVLKLRPILPLRVGLQSVSRGHGLRNHFPNFFFSSLHRHLNLTLVEI
jgi:hypothetical protein